MLKLIPEVAKGLSTAPEGSLRVTKHRNSVQYYKRTDASSKKGIYIPDADYSTTQALAQKRYDEQFLKKAKKQ